jgi:hypothetical protein
LFAIAYAANDVSGSKASVSQTTTLASSAVVSSGIPQGGPASDNPDQFYGFGNTVTNSEGWEMPAGVLVSTTFVTTESSNSFLALMTNVFPYDVAQNTTLYLGLYLNGNLNVTRTEQMGASPVPTASMLGQPAKIGGSVVANFTSSTVSYAAVFHLANPLPAGTTVTLTMYVNSPIWVQLGNNGTSPSFEAPSSTPLPTVLPTALQPSQAQAVNRIPVQLAIEGNSVA